jgi:hypothetical protein
MMEKRISIHKSLKLGAEMEGHDPEIDPGKVWFHTWPGRATLASF